MDTQQHNQVEKNDIEIALLKNNAVIFERMDKAIRENGASITSAIEKKTDGFISEVTRLAATQGKHAVKLTDLEVKYDRLWSRIAFAVAISNIIVGAVIYIVVGGRLGH